MAEGKSEKLYQALNEADPRRAPDIVSKYNQVMDGIDSALIHENAKTARQAKDHLETIADDLIYQQRRAELIDPFLQELDTIAEWLGIATSISTNAKVPKETSVGFGERQRESELRNIFDSFSTQEWREITKTILKEGAGALDIPKERQYRVEQLHAIITALEAIKRKIEGSKGIGEDISQLLEFEGTTFGRIRKITHLIDAIKQVGITEIVQNGLTVENLFLKYSMEFGDKVRDIFRSQAETQAFLDRYGNMVDVTDESKKQAYYLALVKFLRAQSDYQTAQSILEEVLSNEFKTAIDLIPGDPESTDTSVLNVKGRLYDEADAKIGKLITNEVITKWRKDGMNREQIEDAKKNFRDMHYERLLHQYAAKHFLVGDLRDAGEGMHVPVTDDNKAFWKEYNDMLDPKDEAFNLTDESWDMILEELVYTAPMIVVSGGIAGAVAKGLSTAARVALAATRMATFGARLARGGRIARAAYRFGRLSSHATSLLVEGAVFELTFQGIQGEFIFAQEDWVKKILWTSASLGLFKGAGKLGGKGAEAFNKALAEFAPKLADKNLVQLINKLVIVGHTQVAAMLLLGAAQHLTEGQFQEFWNNFGYQMFHAYVAVGSLNLAHGVITSAGGKIFKPSRRPELRVVKGEAKGGQDAERPQKLPIAARVAEAIKAKQSNSLEVSNCADLGVTIETLQREGFKFDITGNGEVVARKGEIEIHLGESGALKNALDALRADAEGLGKIVSENPKGLNGTGFKSFMKSLQELYNKARRFGFSRAQALAMLMAVQSGCAAIEKGGEGIAGGSEFALSTGLPLAGIVIGGILIVGGIVRGLPRGRAKKALARASEIADHALEAKTQPSGADLSVLGIRILESMEGLRKLLPKIHDGHSQSVLREIVDVAADLHTEVTRAAGPRKAQLDGIRRRFSDQLKKLYIPHSEFWSWDNALKIGGSILLLGTALSWLYAANKSKKDDNQGIEEIPIGPSVGGGGEDKGGEVIIVDDGSSSTTPPVTPGTTTPSVTPDATMPSVTPGTTTPSVTPGTTTPSVTPGTTTPKVTPDATMPSVTPGTTTPKVRRFYN